MSEVVQVIAEAGLVGGRRRTWSHYLWLAPTVIALLGITLYPTLFMVYVSFFEWSVIPTLPREFIGLGQYQAILTDPGFWSSVRATGIFLVCAVAIELILGYLLAVALQSDNRVLRAIRAFFLLPIIIAPVVAGLMWKLMLLYDLGVVNYLLGLVGIPKIGWLGESHAALVALILIDVWQWTPFMMLILLAGLESLPTERFEAARVDGAGTWQVFRYLTLPMMLPIITIALLFRTFDAVKTFDIVYVVTKGGPGNSTQLFSYEIWMKGFFQNQLGYAAALSVILVIILTVIAQFYFQALGPSLRVVEE